MPSLLPRATERGGRQAQALRPRSRLCLHDRAGAAAHRVAARWPHRRLLRGRRGDDGEHQPD
eukprot:3852981-Prymnesium_polylepis.1